jgi:hypothetical protein
MLFVLSLLLGYPVSLRLRWRGEAADGLGDGAYER